MDEVEELEQLEKAIAKADAFFDEKKEKTVNIDFEMQIPSYIYEGYYTTGNLIFDSVAPNVTLNINQFPIQRQERKCCYTPTKISSKF